jgi:hypothetical protein
MPGKPLITPGSLIQAEVQQGFGSYHYQMGSWKG